MQSRDGVFRIQECADGDCMFAVGEIDVASGPAFAEALRRSQAVHGGVKVDMSGVTFMDSTGLNALCAVAGDGPVRLYGASDGVRRLLEITGLEHMFTLENHIESGCSPRA